MGRGVPVQKGYPPPPLPEGLFWVRNPTPYACTALGCSGPLSDLLEGFFNLLPKSWRPVLNPQLVEQAEKQVDYLRRRRSRLPQPRTAEQLASPSGVQRGYCCLCGDTGACFTTMGDCRVAGVLQRRLGQC